MGGDYYERDVEVVEPDRKVAFSNAAQKILANNNGLHKSNNPRRFHDENTKLQCKNKNPIVFALDVTGSMGDWSKVLIYYYIK